VHPVDDLLIPGDDVLGRIRVAHGAQVVDALQQDHVLQAAPDQDVPGQPVQRADPVARVVGEHPVAGDALVDDGLEPAPACREPLVQDVGPPLVGVGR
jgi:hypothetical protein